jgi:hypothetical protein
MFVEEIRRAVQAAPRNDLPRLAGLVWKGYAAGAIGDNEAQELAETIKAKKALPPPAKAARGRRCGSRPRSNESLERRRRWCASGKLPPQLASRFTLAEAAALAVIAAQVAKGGDCRLPIGQIAALAGVCSTVVKNALRQARRLELIEVEERRISWNRNAPNIVRVLSTEWRAWLRLNRGQGGGGKLATGTDTKIYYSSSQRPSPAFKRPPERLTARCAPVSDNRWWCG